MSKEAQARIKINKLLEESGWLFLDDAESKANTKLIQPDIDAFGEDFEKSKRGLIDFLLLDDKGFPCAVLEAKSEDKDPLDGKEQARGYAQAQKVRFIILSNGNLHYFWDLEKGNPTIITAFPRPDSLGQLAEVKTHLVELSKEVVTDDYIALTQNSGYQNDPRWHDQAQKAAFIEENGLKFLRPYQLEAIASLQASSKRVITVFCSRWPPAPAKHYYRPPLLNCSLGQKTPSAFFSSLTGWNWKTRLRKTSCAT